MATITDLQQKYKDQLLQDFELGNSTAEVQTEILVMLSKRFSDLAVAVSIAMMNEEQRKRFTAMLADPEKNEEALTSLTAEIPGLQAAIEKAFLEEYEILKGSFVV